jgi:hypothetical protein
MLRAIRRLWLWMRHKHDWVVIQRFNVKMRNRTDDKEWRQSATLERCFCGAERARSWNGHIWERLDMDWVNDQIERKGWDIPARHQE